MIFTEKFNRYGPFNTYDLFKVIAIILMLVGSYGAFIQPANHYFMLFGSMSFPIFFFLIGYSRSNLLRYDLLLLAAFLTLFDMFTKYHLFPLNILFTVAFCRTIMSFLEMNKYLEKEDKFMKLFGALVILSFSTIIVFDYGTISVLFCLLGFLVRTRPVDRKIMLYFLVVGATYIISQILIFRFSWVESAIMLILTTYTLFIMQGFRLATLPELKNSNLKKYLQMPAMFIARNSLYFYALQLIIFKIISMHLHP